MSIIIDVRQLADVNRIVKVLEALNPLASFAGIPAALGQFAGGPFGYAVTTRSPPVPSWVWMDTGDQVLICLAGILSAGDGLAVFASSAQPLVNAGTFSASDLVLSAARQVFGQLGDRFVRGPRSWVLAGHSYGGAIGCALAGVLSNAGVVTDLSLCTFGAPRPGDSSLRDLIARFTVRRYMNSDDPIPRFPPHLREAPALYLSVPFPVAYNWSRYDQPQGGVVLWPDGALSYEQLPPQFLPITDVQLLSWALGDRGFLSTGHRIGEYSFRVAEALAATAAAPPLPLIGSGPEADRPLKMSELQDAAQGSVIDPLSPPGGFKMQGYIPPTYRAKWVKTAPGTYKVQWMGRNVLVGTNRSNARSLARGINGWLRRMQGAASADHTAFNASLADYWNVCVSSSVGFNPPLVVT